AGQSYGSLDKEVSASAYEGAPIGACIGCEQLFSFRGSPVGVDENAPAGFLVWLRAARASPILMATCRARVRNEKNAPKVFQVAISIRSSLIVSNVASGAWNTPIAAEISQKSAAQAAAPTSSHRSTPVPPGRDRRTTKRALMADQEIIAATLAAAIISAKGVSSTHDGFTEAVRIYREVLSQLQKAPPPAAVQGRPTG